MATYITRDGDMLDAICLRHYGVVEGVTEFVLQHNPRLADLGPVFSVGLSIVLPPLPTTLKSPTTIRLWD